MCGIALIYQANGDQPAEATINKMVQSLVHRGPDGQAAVIRGPVALGHTRLSIVDIKGGAQPMVSDDRRYAIIFNGEIYNYQQLRKALEDQGIKFTTDSDTEVILRLYQQEGSACVAKLRGMFSFAIHDAANNALFMARDRLGIKPLVYHWDGQCLLAGSEIKALFASGQVEPKLNPASIRNYFIYQFAIAPHTPFQDIYELPAGHQLSIEQGGEPIVEKYWDLEFPRDGEYESLDENYWTDKFQGALEDAARCHTIGEVPIGAYLSGGVDSATTTWLLTKFYDKPVQSFSVHFPDSALDESHIYRGIAEHLHAGNIELAMENHRPQGYLAELEAAMYFLEQPQRMAMDIPFYLLSKTVRDNGYKVVYSGEGSDEILAGYDCYRQDYMRLWGNDIQNPTHRWLLYFTQFIQNFSEPYIDMIYNLHDKAAQKKVQDKFGCYPTWYDFWQITADLLPGLFNEDFETEAGKQSQMTDLAVAMKPHVEGRHRINQSLYIESKTRLPGWILWRSDRMSMAHSVEGRVPFMDHPLAEVAAGMPPDMKLWGMNEKYVLKKIAMPHLPQHPTQYRKQGFYTPIRDWLFSPDYDAQLETYLSAEALQDAGIFNVSTVSLLRQQIMSAATPDNQNEHYQLMKLEWVMMLVLTVQILHAQFVRKQAPCFH